MSRLSAVLVVLLFGVSPSLAHDGVDHPKCKKGYVLDTSHRCVKKG